MRASRAGSKARTNAAGDGAHHLQHALDGIQHALHAAERQRRGDEADHLAIGGLLVAVHHPHRIGNRAIAR